MSRTIVSDIVVRLPSCARLGCCRIYGSRFVPIQFRQRFRNSVETATSCLSTPSSIVVRVSVSLLSDSEIDVPQNEKSGEDPDQSGNFPKFADSDFDHGIGDQPQADTGGDAEGQRSGEHGDEGRNRLAELAPFDVRY